MARSDAVWGIDIGQCALKAIRLRAGDAKDKVVADAFDFIEYPKILSQPGSEPAELIAEALQQFLSRNTVRGDRVAISVAGQSGLARFIKLPPVEVKKIPDIVRFEARQQIPFDLNDVIWDFQRMGGGSEEEGFALETEIGLFAMKRDAVYRALEPFKKAGIEVDIVQLTPLALYNYACFDQLSDLPSLEDYDPDNPPESIVIISLGTDATDLVITNGFRVWQRSVPIGGNHFTKALTKDLKLTFAKAEHLKRNAATAQDSKALYQAMRPVFADLVTQLQLSLGYFTNLNRNARIGRVVALGNAMKLPGLRKYLSQNLGYDVEKIDSFHGLGGSQVTSVSAFRDNLLSFGVSYGLALQGLSLGGLRTNLLPREIVKERLIRRKKPWTVAAAALLLVACTVGFASMALGLGTVDTNKWGSAVGQAKSVKSTSDGLRQQADAAMEKFKGIQQIGDHLVSNVEGRVAWLEMLKVINACLPGDPPDQRPNDIGLRNELNITNIEAQHFDDLSRWFSRVKPFYQMMEGEKQEGAAAAGDGADASGGGSAQVAGPTGPGWVIQLSGYHYHNKLESQPNIAVEFIRRTFLANLANKTVELPGPDGQTMVQVKAADIGLGYPVVVNPAAAAQSVDLTRPGSDLAASGAPAETVEPVKLWKYPFVIQMTWQMTLPTERQKKMAERAAQEAAAAGDNAAAPAANSP